MATTVELKRGYELFKTLIRNQGLEASLVPYLERYHEEDGEEYQFQQLLGYIKIFVESDQITPEAIKRYNKLRSISKSTLSKRGKEICDTLMANNFNMASLEGLARQYATEDKRYLPYSTLILNRMRKFYLNEANEEYLTKYQEMLELSKRSTTEGYSFATFKTIINFNDAFKAMEYIHEKGITYEIFRGLRNAYFSVYPEEDSIRPFIDEIENLFLLERQSQAIENAKKAQKKAFEKIKNTKNERTKRILKAYIYSGKDNISECVASETITVKTFLDNLKNVENEDDDELKELYAEYQKQVAAYEEERKNVATKLLDYYVNGVYYGMENRRLSLYDYYCLTDKPASEVARSISTYLPMGAGVQLIRFINELTITRRFKDRDEFIGHLRSKYKQLTPSEYEPIVDYIEKRNWPYSLTLFQDIWERLADGLITLEMPEEKENNNLNK